MAKKKVYRRRTASVGIATATGALVAAACPLIGQYDIIYEVANGGGKVPEALLSKIVQNTRNNVGVMIPALVLPALAKQFLPNPTVYRGKRLTLKAI